MQLTVVCKTLDRRDIFPFGAKGGIQAAMHRLRVDPHGARAAVAGVTALLDSVPAEVAKKDAQAFARGRRRSKTLAINAKIHDSNSRRICSA